MTNLFYTAALGAALILSAAPALAASEGSLQLDTDGLPSLAEHLQSSTGEARAAVLQEVIQLANTVPAQLDVPTLLPVLFSIASNDENPHFRTMAGQAIATVGSRADARRLARIARRDPSPWASRQMQLAAASALRR